MGLINKIKTIRERNFNSEQKSAIGRKATIGAILASLALLPRVYFANSMPISEEKVETHHAVYIYPQNKSPIECPTDDFDKDGLSNQDEITLGTNPLDQDSDGDSIDDLAEIEQGSNPKVNEPEFFIVLNKKYLILPRISESVSQKTTNEAETSSRESLSGMFGLEVSNKPKIEGQIGSETDKTGTQSTQIENSYSKSIEDYVLNFSITFHNNLPKDIDVENIIISPSYKGQPFHQTTQLENNFEVKSVNENPKKKIVKNYAISIPKEVFEWIKEEPEGLELNLFYTLKNDDPAKTAINNGERKCGKVVLYDRQGKAIESIFIYGPENFPRSIKDVLGEKYHLEYQNNTLLHNGEEIRIFENGQEITDLQKNYHNDKEYHIIPSDDTLKERVLMLFNRYPSTAIETDIIGNDLKERISANLKDSIEVESLGDFKEREYRVLENNNKLFCNPWILAMSSVMSGVPIAARYIAGKVIMDFFFGKDETFYIDDITYIPNDESKDHIVLLGRYFSPEKKGETRIYELYSFGNNNTMKREAYFDEGIYIEKIAIPGREISEELKSKILFIGHEKEQGNKGVYGINYYGEISKIFDIED